MKTRLPIRDFRKLPLVTLSLALIITVIHISRMVQGENNEVWNALTGWFIHLFDQPWRVITTSLLHNDLVHYLDNLLFLLLLGWYNERRHGWRMVLWLFLGSVIVSEMAYIYFHHSWSEEISGFTYALFGFSLVANWRWPRWKNITHNPIHLLFVLDAVRVLVMEFTGLTEQISPAMGMPYYEIAHLTHLAGFLYGLASAWAFSMGKRRLVLRWALILLPILCLVSLFYSPWLPEWRLVKWGPILTSQQADCSQASVEGITSASFSIENQSDKPVAYYWLPPEGGAVFYGFIQPHDSMDDQAGYLSYAWCVVDADTHLASLQIIQTEEKQIFTLQNGGWHATPPLPITPTPAAEYQDRYKVIVPTAEEEAQYVWFTLQQLNFYDQNGYSPVFPDDPAVTALMQKARETTLADSDYASLQEAMDRVYRADDYDKGYQIVNASLATVEQVLPTFEKYNREWGFKVFPTYTVLLTLYGPGGSYDPQTGTILMRTSKDGKFATGSNPAENIIHESVHLGIEPLIEQYSIEHWVMERIVDKFVADHFHPLLPWHQLQPEGDKSINKYLDSPGAWDKLPEIIEEYNEPEYIQDGS